MSWKASGEFVQHDNLQSVLEEFKERIFEEFEARILEKIRAEMVLSSAAITGSLPHENAKVGNRNKKQLSFS